jgi:thiamine kinase-like enzyme
VDDQPGQALEIEPVARRVPGWADLDLTITPIALGITNRNYKVMLPDGQAYVVRLPGERTEVLGIDRSCEAEAAIRAAELGIGPAVLGELPGVGTLVTEFLPGGHAVDGTFARPDRVRSVVALLRDFHGSGPIAGQFPIHRVVEWHARDAARFGVRPPAAFDWLHERSAAIEASFGTHPSDPVPCHNDLLPANVLFTTSPAGERAWLLDFEYAGMNDASFDLANLSVNAGFDGDADEWLLTGYFGGIDTTNLARLELMKIMSEFREGMWAVVQQAISTLDTVDFVAYADERLENCRRLCSQPSFTTWLDQAASAT